MISKNIAIPLVAPGILQAPIRLKIVIRSFRVEREPPDHPLGSRIVKDLRVNFFFLLLKVNIYFEATIAASSFLRNVNYLLKIRPLSMQTNVNSKTIKQPMNTISLSYSRNATTITVRLCLIHCDR